MQSRLGNFVPVFAHPDVSNRREFRRRQMKMTDKVSPARSNVMYKSRNVADGGICLLLIPEESNAPPAG